MKVITLYIHATSRCKVSKPNLYRDARQSILKLHGYITLSMVVNVKIQSLFEFFYILIKGLSLVTFAKFLICIASGLFVLSLLFFVTLSLM